MGQKPGADLCKRQVGSYRNGKEKESEMQEEAESRAELGAPRGPANSEGQGGLSRQSSCWCGQRRSEVTLVKTMSVEMVSSQEGLG